MAEPRKDQMEIRALEMVRQARQAIEVGNTTRGRDLLAKAWAQARHSEKVLMSVAGSLIDIGEDELAYSTLQEAAVHQGESEALYRIIGEMALRMQIADVAETAFSKACSLKPSEPSHYVNLAESLRLNNKPDAAIELLKTSLPQFPDHAGMWNALAQLTLNHLQDRDNALIFEQEAVKNAPKSADFLHNLALMYGSRPEAGDAFEAALALEPKNPQINLSYALYLLSWGRLEEGWPRYEYRLDPALGYTRTARYTHGIKPWKGQDLKDKSILLCAEQGIGDEVMFALFFRDVIARADKVYIGCEPRLVSLYQRSFPTAEVAAFEDQRTFRFRDRSFPALESRLGKDLRIDYALPVGSLPLYLGRDVQAFRSHEGGFAVPDPELVARLRPRLNDGTRLRVGISWRSGNLKQERALYYLTTALYQELVPLCDADFYVLQYTYSAEEREALAHLPNVHFFDDIDLKQDIEANIALLSMMDVSVGPPTATQMFAMAAGCPVFLANRGTPWNLFHATRSLEKNYAPGSCFIDINDPRPLIETLRQHLVAMPQRAR